MKTIIQKISYVTCLLAFGAALSACDDGGDGADAGGGGGATASGGSSSSSGGSSTTSGGSAQTGGSGGEAASKPTLLEIAAGDENFSILVDAVEKAGLASALEGDGLTVFAPTNAAFADLLETLGLDSLDDLSADQLKPILLYHVVGGVVMAEDATKLAEGTGSFASLGGTVKIAPEGDALRLDDRANITDVDIEAENGVIHVIDQVILPSIADIVTTSDSLTGLKGLVESASGTPNVGTALDSGEWTLFAPDNDAVADVTSPPSGQNLTNVLLHHVIADDTIYAATALGLAMPTDFTAAFGTITVSGGDSVKVAGESAGEGTVTIANIYAENGVIHVMDAVILPNL